MILTNTADSGRLDRVRSHKAWVLRWLILTALSKPSDDASFFCLGFNPDIPATQELMREILGLSSIDGLERWILHFIDSMPSEVIGEAGLALHTLGFYDLCVNTLALIDPSNMGDTLVLYTLCDALQLSGQIAKAIALFDENMLPEIESDDEAAFALLGINVFKAAQLYERALWIADKMLVIHTLHAPSRHALLFQRAEICIKLHDNQGAIASLEALKIQKDDPAYFEYSLLRARVSPPSDALTRFESLLHTLGVQSVAKPSSGRSSLGHPSSSNTSPTTSASTPERDVNGLEFKIRLAKLRVQLKTANSANELDALLKACAELEWACHPKVSFIWACASVKRAWFCVPERSNLRHLPQPSSYIPFSRPPPSRRMIDQVQALNASGSSLFSSAGARSGNGTPRLGASGRPSSSYASTASSHSTLAAQSAAAPSSSAPSATHLNLGSISHESSAPTASPTLHRSRGRRNSNGAAVPSDMQKYLNLARNHFQCSRERVIDPSSLVSQYHKVLALHLHAPTEEYALELKEEAQKFLDQCNASGGTYFPKVAVLLASVLRKDGHLTDALGLLDQTQNTAPVQIERLLCKVAESRIINLGESDGLTRESSQRILDALASTSISAATSSAPGTSTASLSSASAYSTTSEGAAPSARGQSHHQLAVNRVIDELSQIKGRYWDAAQFHAGRLYEDELGQLEQADMRYRQVTLKNPRHMQSLYRLAFLRCRRAHPESIASCSLILSHYPYDLKVLEWRAGAYVLLCKYVEAIRDYERILSIDRSIQRIQRARDAAAVLLTSTGYYSTMVSESAQVYGQSIKTLFKSYWYGGQE